MASAAQLLLLADHVKFSVLERQRAISLNLEPNTQDAQISRSLNTLQQGIEELEASESASAQETHQLRQQYNDLYSQFTGEAAPTPTSTTTTRHPTSPAPAPANDSAAAQTQRPGAPRQSNSSSKFVRFTDTPSKEEDSREDPNRARLLPYKDDPDDAAPDQSALDNQQIHAYHTQALREQDAQLDELGHSVGRQRELSIQIGSELDEQNEMLDELDHSVTRHQTQIDKARGRLGNIARKAKDNMQLTIIFILIIILVLLIIVLR